MITFKSDFETHVNQYPNPVNNWRDPQPYPLADRLTRVTSPVRTGSYALKATVKPGDSYGSSGERAEVYSMFGADGKHIVENEASGTQYYTVSVYLPLDFKSPSQWGSFQQLHGSDKYSAPPIFAIGAMNDFYVQMWTGELSEANYTKPERLHRIRYSLAPVIRGQWVDFVWRIKYARTYTGTLDVWMRTSGDFENVLSVANIPTLQFSPVINAGEVLDAYWKTGYYSSAENFTRVVYVDSHGRGDNFDELIAAVYPVEKIFAKIEYRGWGKNLSIRPSPSMHNDLGGYFLPNKNIPL
jgi:hypothetical protein